MRKHIIILVVGLAALALTPVQKQAIRDEIAAAPNPMCRRDTYTAWSYLTRHDPTNVVYTTNSVPRYDDPVKLARLVAVETRIINALASQGLTQTNSWENISDTLGDTKLTKLQAVANVLREDYGINRLSMITGESNRVQVVRKVFKDESRAEKMGLPDLTSKQVREAYE